MEVSFSFLCDYADNSGGKLTAVEIGIDTIYALTTPAHHRILYAVIAIKLSSVEAGARELGLRLVNAGGHEIGPPIDRTINVALPNSSYTYRIQRVVMGIGNRRFETFGDYAIVWLLNGQEINRIPIKVSEPPESPTTA